MPFDTSFLANGVQGVQVPDPMRMATQGLALSQMADSNTMRRLAMQQAQQEQAARDALNQALPQVMAAGWSPESIQRAIQQAPSAAGPLLTMLDQKRKAEADYANTNAQAAERTASAQKSKLAPITNMAYQLANKPDLNSQDIAGFSKLVSDNGLEHLIPNIPMQTWTNPDAARAGLKTIGSAFFDAEKQTSTAETAKQNIATNAQAAANAAETARYHTGELGIQGGRLALERQNANRLQHITMPDGSAYTFDPSSGKFAQGTDQNGQPIVGTKPLTETQGNATAFGMRMKASNDIISGLEQSGFDLGSIPNKFLPESQIGNYIADPKAQQAYAAKLNFMTASLRKESGAAISPSEFETEDKKYFPQPGDSQPMRDQKARMRALALDAMSIQAGPGAKFVNSTQSGTRQASGKIAAPQTVDKMPDPSTLADNTVVTDNVTGRKMTVKGGRYTQ